MKAVVMRGHGDVDVLDVVDDQPMPQPGPGQMLVQVVAAGVNRADLLQRAGHYPPPPGASPLLGLEIAGCVTVLGDDVTDFSIGERVHGLVDGGGYAEYSVLDSSLAMATPDAWSEVFAAATPEIFMTADHALCHLGELRAGETVLIQAGGSGVGSTAIQMAKRIGATVITTVGSAKKLERCHELGADVVVNYRETDFLDVVKDVTRGRGVNLVIDFIGAKYLERHLKALATEGRMVHVGLLGGAKAEINLAMVLSKRLQLKGMVLRAQNLKAKTAIKERMLARWSKDLQAGVIRPAMDRSFAMKDVREAHRYMAASKHFGKIVLEGFAAGQKEI